MFLYVVNSREFVHECGCSTYIVMNKKKSTPPRVGLSLHKHLVSEVLHKSEVLGMNPNEFVNQCVQECTDIMSEPDPVDVTVPLIIEEYRRRQWAEHGPMHKRLNPQQYALVCGIDELQQELSNMRHDLMSLAEDEAPRLDPATFDVIKLFREKRDALMADAMARPLPPSRVRLLDPKTGKGKAPEPQQ